MSDIYYIYVEVEEQLAVVVKCLQGLYTEQCVRFEIKDVSHFRQQKQQPQQQQQLPETVYAHQQRDRALYRERMSHPLDQLLFQLILILDFAIRRLSYIVICTLLSLE